MNQKQTDALRAFEGSLADVLGVGSIAHTMAQREFEKLKTAFSPEPAPEQKKAVP